jgi:hypothetical protein
MTDVPHDRSAGSGDAVAAKSNGNAGSKKPTLVAVDLGAESCRLSLLRWVDGQPEIRLVYRFANSPRNSERGICWDVEAIVKGADHRANPSVILFVIATNVPWAHRKKFTNEFRRSDFIN